MDGQTLRSFIRKTRRSQPKNAGPNVMEKDTFPQYPSESSASNCWPRKQDVNHCVLTMVGIYDVNNNNNNNNNNTRTNVYGAVIML